MYRTHNDDNYFLYVLLNIQIIQLNMQFCMHFQNRNVKKNTHLNVYFDAFHLSESELFTFVKI